MNYIENNSYLYESVHYNKHRLFGIKTETENTIRPHKQ